MRALLVYNPNATTTNPSVIEAITGALSRELKLEVEATKRRAHAGYLAAGAAHEGHEVVIALGGDGTVNEVLQGLVGTSVKLAIIPGGSTNVWARNLGLPNNAVEATTAVLTALRERSERSLNLGRVNGRYFGVNAGFGYDAEVVRFVEQRHRLKRTVRQASFLYCGALAYARGYDRSSQIRLSLDGSVVEEPLRSVVICNANPYTYLGRMPVQLCPEASYDQRLDLLGLTSLTLPTVVRLARTALTTSNVGNLGFTRLWQNEPSFQLVSEHPLPLQVDGDFVDTFTRVRVDHVERGITVVV